MKILFVGGGSIGHIAPSVAVWEEIQKTARAYLPAGQNVEAHFVCSPRPDDAKFLEDNQLEYSILDAPRLSLMFPFKLMGAIKNAKKILHDQHPDLIFSKGSYISLPLCIAAKKKGIPIVLQDSDSVPGRANMIVSKWADHICTGFPTTTDNRQPTTFTGNPLRPNITNGSKQEALRITGFDGSKPILLIMGGSQGALSVNETIEKQIDDVLLRCDIIHITGRGKATGIPQSSHYYQTEFVNEELVHFYAAADAAVSRAGANAIAELAANTIPTILIPLRGVGHDHQYKNAQVASQHGCIHLEQSNMHTDLLKTVHALITDKKRQEEMSEKIQELAQPDAALQIAKIILQTLDSGPRDQ